jgi:hypothetical protein
MEKRRKAEKDKGKITKHEIMKKSIMKEVEVQGNVQERIWSNSLYIFSSSAWFMYALFHSEESRNTFFEMLVLCSDQKMIPARNDINAHAQIFLVSD